MKSLQNLETNGLCDLLSVSILQTKSYSLADFKTIMIWYDLLEGKEKGYINLMFCQKQWTSEPVITLYIAKCL